MGLIIINILQLKFYLTLFLDTELLQYDSLSIFQKSDSFLLKKFFSSLFLIVFLHWLIIFYLLVSCIDGVKKIRFYEFLESTKLKTFIKEFVINFCGDTHQPNRFCVYLTYDCFTLRIRVFSHSSSQVLSGNQVSNKELSELTGKNFRLFIKNLCKIIMIFLFCHSYFHFFNWMIFGRVK